MPKVDEVATVIVNGQRYSSWKTVSINRSFERAGAVADVSILEVDISSKKGALQQIVVGAPAQVLLGGVLAIDGAIQVRQAAMTPAAHGLQIRIISNTVLAVKSSVQTQPGQFKNQTLKQIANSLLSPLGIAFRYAEGAIPPLAEKVFDRLNLNPGETIFEAIARMAWFRNVLLTDDAQGDIVAMRPGNSGAVFAELIDIKSGNAILSNKDVLSRYDAQGQHFGSDNLSGRPAAAPAATAMSFGERGTYRNIISPMSCDAQDCALLANRQIAQDITTSVEIAIVVPGWFVSSGTLWMNGLGKIVKVVSPTLLPASFDQSSKPLYIKEVTHRQNDAAGTETEVVLGLANDLSTLGIDLPGGGDQSIPLGASPTPAAPLPPN